MDCPNCGSGVLADGKCGECFVDVALYQKVINISNLLYNEGLSKAKTRDLSGAIGSLSKSLKYNKKNTNARNLLGLIYFEIGRLGEAYNNFVLSLSYQRDGNKAQKYIDLISSPSHKMDAMRDSVRIYNQGLTYLNQKSDDIAIIQLKKAIDINPTFIDALNLLAVAYIYQKDNIKAIQMIDKVLAFDIKNLKALEYRSEIINTVPAKKYDTATNLKTTKKNNATFAQTKRRGFFGSPSIFSIGYILIGFIFSFLAFFVFFIPGITASNSEIIKALDGEKNELEITLANLKEENEVTIKNLQAATKELESQKQSLEEKVNIQNKREVLNESQIFVNNGQYEEAAELLYSLDPTGLPVDLSDKRSGLVAEAYPRACNSLYNRAASRYRARDYDSAEELFNKCILYADIGSNYAGDSYYYLAEIYYVREDKETSKQLFEKVVAEYPASNFYWVAANRLDNRF
jgi:tetratricopeptide (TPR) repeat protein